MSEIWLFLAAAVVCVGSWVAAVLERARLELQRKRIEVLKEQVAYLSEQNKMFGHALLVACQHLPEDIIVRVGEIATGEKI